MSSAFDADLADVAGADDQFAQLTVCARHELTSLQLMRLSRMKSELPAADRKPLKVAVLGSATCQHLAPGIECGGLRYGLDVEVFSGEYGQFRQEIASPASPLHDFGPDYVLLSLHAGAYLGTVDVTATAAAVAARVDAITAELSDLWAQAQASFGARVVQQTLLDTEPNTFGALDRTVPGSPFHFIDELNRALTARAAQEGVLLLDVARQSARDGLAHWHDRTQWLHGKMDISPKAGFSYGCLLGRQLMAAEGRARKCLVLDLDNTLWGGVVGDDGVEGLILGPGSVLGEAFADVQRYAKLLSQRGIVLAVCSKNEESIAQRAFREHPEMVLALSDIAVFVANWQDKASNLRAIAQRLNIGLDSLVFLDDNPVERAQVRQVLPMVAVPELPADPAEFVGVLSGAGYFDTVAFTQDDRERAAQYAANAKRAEVAAGTGSMQEFLASLDMEMKSGEVGDVDLARCAQLVGKTNQFNTTTRRYTAAEIKAFCTADDGLALWFRLADRFGDNGLVSVVLCEVDRDEPDAFVIRNWVMSCRVFGRELEHEILNEVVSRLRERAAYLVGEFVPTAKNAVIATLFDRLGFEAERVGDAERWRLDLAAFEPLPTEIRHMTTDGETA